MLFRISFSLVRSRTRMDGEARPPGCRGWGSLPPCCSHTWRGGWERGSQPSVETGLLPHLAGNKQAHHTRTKIWVVQGFGQIYEWLTQKGSEEKLGLFSPLTWGRITHLSPRELKVRRLGGLTALTKSQLCWHRGRETWDPQAQDRIRKSKSFLGISPMSFYFLSFLKLSVNLSTQK